MDSTEVPNNPNPRENANFLSLLLFGYTIPTFRKGMKKDLDIGDVYNTLKSDRSDTLCNKLEMYWNKEIEQVKKNVKETPSLGNALLNTFWVEFALLGILLAIGDLAIRTCVPYMLGGILDYYTPGSTETKFEAYMYAVGLVTFTLSQSLASSQYINNAAHAGMRVRAAVCALIYRKATRLSRTALGDTPAGKVVNLLSNDVSRFDYASVLVHQMWVGPLSGVIVMIMLYLRSGLASLAGILVVVLMSPLQVYSGKVSAKFRQQTAVKTDERIRLMDEIILGIQVIKMYAWEIPFQKVVDLARKAEIKIIRKSAYVRALFITLGMVTTRLALFATLLTITLTGEEITAAKVFVVMSYFNLLSTTLTGIFIRGIQEVSEVFVSIKRLQDFLVNEEYKYDQFDSITADTDTGSKAILSVNNLSAKWNSHLKQTVLKNINIEVNRGKLIGIIGPVGSGKSSLLQTFLGELDIVEGSLHARGKYSYASQEPWIFAATIRQNILFGADYDKKRFKEVIKVCALEKDLEQFESGDLTIVGDKGASLSGGQKARINLARAVYRDLDIYLLDDPLSAVDIHVSKVLYEKCINGFLANKTRILVTHQVHYLKNADNILILHNGRIESEGTFNDLANSDNEYAQLLATEPEIPEVKEEEHQNQINDVKYTRQISKRSRKSSTKSTLSSKSKADSITDDEDLGEDDADKKPKMIDMQEESSKGKVVGSLLIQYFRNGANFFNLSLIMILYVTVQVVGSIVDYFVSFWTNLEEMRNQKNKLNSTQAGILANNTNSTAASITNTTAASIAKTYSDISWYPDWSTETCLYIYGGLIAIVVVLTLGRSFSFYSLAMSCSEKLHKLLFRGIIYAKMRFFDTNPSGRVLNRFSKDVGSIDEVIPKVVLDGGQLLLQMFGSLVLVGIANPYAIILGIAVAVMTGLMRSCYLKTSKNIKRVEGMLRSPIFTHLNATLQGLPTIRALRSEKTLQEEFDKIQNYHISSYFMNLSTVSAFGFSLDLLSCVFITILTFSILAFDEALGLLGGTVGLAISQASSLTGMIQNAMRVTADIANQLMSVERVLEYKQLPPEPEPPVPQNIPKAWPNSGKIDFEDMKLRYFEEGPLIIKDFSLQIQPREKIGIVGRTGAGKSSLIAALFRLANVEGKIAIDGVETKDIRLLDLRRNISIIPQDPVLFSGTLRYNLDPFDEYSDETLYKALDDVELKDPDNIINKLENRVMDRGANYSVGQRQLICLARAIIRNNKVLMLDEATANVDPQTDALIQTTIRTKFVDCTVLTVAHRLNTIMDSDKVLVMDQGRVAEFDHPHILLQNSNGIFSGMVNDTGHAESEHLKSIAKDIYKKTRTIPE